MPECDDPEGSESTFAPLPGRDDQGRAEPMFSPLPGRDDLGDTETTLSPLPGRDDFGGVESTFSPMPGYGDLGSAESLGLRSMLNAYESPRIGGIHFVLKTMLQDAFAGPGLQPRLQALQETLLFIENNPEEFDDYMAVHGVDWLLDFLDWSDAERCHSVANIFVALVQVAVSSATSCAAQLAQVARQLVENVLDEDLAEALSKTAAKLPFPVDNAEAKPLVRECGAPASFELRQGFLRLLQNEAAAELGSVAAATARIQLLFDEVAKLPLIDQFLILNKGLVSFVLYVLVNMEPSYELAELLVRNTSPFVAPTLVFVRSCRYRMPGEAFLTAHAAQCGVLQLLVLILESGECREAELERLILRTISDLWMSTAELRKCLHHHVSACLRILQDSLDTDVRDHARYMSELVDRFAASMEGNPDQTSAEVTIVQSKLVCGRVQKIDTWDDFKVPIALPVTAELTRGRDVTARVNVHAAKSMLVWNLTAPSRTRVWLSVWLDVEPAERMEEVTDAPRQSSRPLLGNECCSNERSICVYPKTAVEVGPHNVANGFTSVEPGRYRFVLQKGRLLGLRNDVVQYRLCAMSPDSGEIIPPDPVSSVDPSWAANVSSDSETGAHAVPAASLKDAREADEGGMFTSGQQAPRSQRRKVSLGKGLAASMHHTVCFWITPRALHIDVFQHGASVLRRSRPRSKTPEAPLDAVELGIAFREMASQVRKFRPAAVWAVVRLATGSDKASFGKSGQTTYVQEELRGHLSFGNIPVTVLSDVELCLVHALSSHWDEWFGNTVVALALDAEAGAAPTPAETPSSRKGKDDGKREGTALLRADGVNASQLPSRVRSCTYVGGRIIQGPSDSFGEAADMTMSPRDALLHYALAACNLLAPQVIVIFELAFLNAQEPAVDACPAAAAAAELRRIVSVKGRQDIEVQYVSSAEFCPLRALAEKGEQLRALAASLSSPPVLDDVSIAL